MIGPCGGIQLILVYIVQKFMFMGGGGEITCTLLWMWQMLGEAHICSVGRSAFTECGNYI
jgi:hypothetical protein